MTLHKSIEALIKEMDNAISDVGAVSKLGTIPDIWCDIRAALTDAPSCEAVGKEHCWTHDRPGEECHAPSAEDVREDLLEEVELCLHNHDGAAVNLRYFNEDDVSALNYSYIEVTKMLGKTFNFIRAAQSRPVFTESTPEQVEKIKGLLDKTAPWEVEVVTVDELKAVRRILAEADVGVGTPEYAFVGMGAITKMCAHFESIVDAKKGE